MTYCTAHLRFSPKADMTVALNERRLPRYYDRSSSYQGFNLCGVGMFLLLAVRSQCGRSVRARKTPCALPKIEVLLRHAANPGEEAPYFTSLIEGFRSLGYGEGHIVLEHRFPAESGNCSQAWQPSW